MAALGGTTRVVVADGGDVPPQPPPCEVVKVIVLVGGPGSGKSSFGQWVKMYFGFEHVSCGDIHRSLPKQLRCAHGDLSWTGKLITSALRRSILAIAPGRTVVVDGLRNLVDFEHDMNRFNPGNPHRIELALIVELKCSPITMASRIKARRRAGDVASSASRVKSFLKRKIFSEESRKHHYPPSVRCISIDSTGPIQEYIKQAGVLDAFAECGAAAVAAIGGWMPHVNAGIGKLSLDDHPPSVPEREQESGVADLKRPHTSSASTTRPDRPTAADHHVHSVQKLSQGAIKLGIYFGSFDPVHENHVALAKHAIAHGDLNHVIFVANATLPAKPFLSSLALREELLAARVELEPRMALLTHASEPMSLDMAGRAAACTHIVELYSAMVCANSAANPDDDSDDQKDDTSAAHVVETYQILGEDKLGAWVSTKLKWLENESDTNWARSPQKVMVFPRQAYTGFKDDIPEVLEGCIDVVVSHCDPHPGCSSTKIRQAMFLGAEAFLSKHGSRWLHPSVSGLLRSSGYYTCTSLSSSFLQPAASKPFLILIIGGVPEDQSKGRTLQTAAARAIGATFGTFNYSDGAKELAASMVRPFTGRPDELCSLLHAHVFGNFEHFVRSTLELSWNAGLVVEYDVPQEHVASCLELLDELGIELKMVVSSEPGQMRHFSAKQAREAESESGWLGHAPPHFSGRVDAQTLKRIPTWVTTTPSMPNTSCAFCGQSFKRESKGTLPQHEHRASNRRHARYHAREEACKDCDRVKMGLALTPCFVIVTNVPPEAKPADISQFFQSNGCKEAVRSTFISVRRTTNALVEFESKSEEQAARRVTRDCLLFSRVSCASSCARWSKCGNNICT